MKRIIMFIFCAICLMTTFAQSLESGLYYIKSSINQKFVLGLPYGNNVNGNKVILWEFLGDASQQWYVSNNGDGSIRIHNVNSSSFSLDADGNQAFNGNIVQVWQNYDNFAQKWYPVFSNGAWIIQSGVNRNFALDVDDCQMFNNNKIQLWQCNGSNAQRWIFVPIRNNNSGAGSSPTIPIQPYQPTQHADPCGVCSRTGKCWNCHGSGVSVHASGIRATCGACGGRGICTRCNGLGVNYNTY